MSLTIPNTDLRLQPYISVRSALYSSIDQLPSFSTMTPVLAVQKVTMTNSRPVHLWRELGTDNFQGPTAQPIKGTYPGLATYELELDRIVLYDNTSANRGTIVKALGFESGADLMYQSQALVLAFQLYEPGNTGGTTYLFYGCWLQDNPFAFDVNADDLKITQTVKITAAGVKQS